MNSISLENSTTKEIFLFNWKHAFLIVLFLISQTINPLVSNIGYLGCIILILKGKEYPIKAITLSVFITFLNPEAFSPASLSTALRWGVLFLAFFKAYSKGHGKQSQWAFFLFAFAVYCIVGSFLHSYSFVTSLFKLISFVIGVLAIERSFANCRHYNYTSWFYTLFIVCLVLSLPLIIHLLGYVRKGRGFQGILSHPNAFGIYMAPFIGWVLLGTMFEKSRNKKIFLYILGLVGIGTLIASESRTSVFASIIAILFSIFLQLQKKNFRQSRPIVKIQKILLFITLIFSIVILLFPDNIIFKKFSEFAIKSQNVEDIGVQEALLKSRSELIDLSMKKFKEHPFLGNGFGMPSEREMLNTQFVLGIIPIASAIEKGFLVTAVLEETGVIGFLLVVFFIASYYAIINKTNAVYFSVMFWTSIAVTLGEMVFFAAGGLGLQIFLIMGFARNYSIVTVYKEKYE